MGFPPQHVHSASVVDVDCVSFWVQEDLDILGSIGEGAFGDVSLAHSPMFGKVATKWLKPNKVAILDTCFAHLCVPNDMPSPLQRF